MTTPPSDNPRKPYLEDAKSISRRRHLYDCDLGDRVKFVDGDPNLLIGGQETSGFGDVGDVMMFLNGKLFVRFELDGEDHWSEPYVVAGNPRILRIEGSR